MNTQSRPTYLVIGLAIALGGCKPAQEHSLVDSESRTAIANLVAEVTSLKTDIRKSNDDVVDLKNKISTSLNAQKDLQERVNQLARQIYFLESARTEHNSITIDPGAPRAYQRLDSTTGSFFVLLESVTPYLDGQKITLKIGNPSGATYSGFTLKVKWGVRYPTYDPNNDTEYAKQLDLAIKSTQQRDIKLTDSLVGGRWNNVSFNLTPAAAKDFGRLELEIVTNTIQLTK